MSRIVDNAIAFKVLHMLVTNFTDTEAFKLGIIDAHGNTLRKTNQFSTDAERNAFNYLTRLVFNMKKLINKIGGENRLKSMAAALWLIRENYESGSRTTALLESKFKKLIDSDVHLVEEEIFVGRFLSEGIMSDLPNSDRTDKKGDAYNPHRKIKTASDVNRINAAKERGKKETGLYKKQSPSQRAQTVKQYMDLLKHIKEDGMGVGAVGGAPTNNTSGPVSTQEPKIDPKSKKKPIIGMARRLPLAVKEIK